jgi:hypothetical protein
MADLQFLRNASGFYYDESDTRKLTENVISMTGEASWAFNNA